MCAHPGHDHGRDRAAAARNVVCDTSIKTSSFLRNWIHTLHFLFYGLFVNVNRDQQVSIYRDLSTCPNSHVYRVRGFYSALRTRLVRHCRTIGKLVYSYLWLLFINSCERGSACIHYRDQSEFIWHVGTIVFILSKMYMYVRTEHFQKSWLTGKRLFDERCGSPTTLATLLGGRWKYFQGGVGRLRRPGLHRTGL